MCRLFSASTLTMEYGLHAPDTAARLSPAPQQPLKGWLVGAQQVANLSVVATLVAQVSSREFPSAAFSPYQLADEEVAALERALHSEGMQAAAQAVAAAREAHQASADWAEP